MGPWRIRRSLPRGLMPLSLLLASLISSCAAGTRAHSGISEPSLPEAVPLPPPRVEGPVSLEESLQRRRSVRTFTGEDLTLQEIGQLLWAAQGITDPAGYRVAPSAGALYPLEAYVVRQQGIFHYDPKAHAIVPVKSGDVRRELSAAALDQEAVAEAPVILVIAAVYKRTQVKYGPERTPRYVHMEAGHAGQNVLLQAVSLGLGAVPIGAFVDDEVQALLDLPPDCVPLYLIPVGHPR
jgi:SagB-type dehydrogenase family enzyme